MGRALRIEGAGLWYHVMCRGNGGHRIFNDEKDYLAFLAREKRTTRERSPPRDDVAGARTMRERGNDAGDREGNGRLERLGGGQGTPPDSAQGDPRQAAEKNRVEVCMSVHFP